MRAALTRAERQANTRRDLVDVAERLFTAQGFHPTSLDAVADEAGYTKGAVYSNFASKEDLFFGVYERRVERYLENAERTLVRNGGPDQAVLAIIAETAARREHDDGWLAVFLEFWTHVLRHPEHRARLRRYTPAQSIRSRQSSRSSRPSGRSSCRSTLASWRWRSSPREPRWG
jgi:AcrR family transcriptional regulator